MGQTASSPTSLPRHTSPLGGLDATWDNFLHEQIRKHSQTLRQLTLLTYDELQDKICQLNAM